MGTSPSKPRGTYPTYHHDRHTVRHLIKAKHLAPFYHEPVLLPSVRRRVSSANTTAAFTSAAAAAAASTDECPICLLSMPVKYLNWTVCCRHAICTECFLQLRRTKVDEEVRCVYCNRDGVGVFYEGGARGQLGEDGRHAGKAGDNERERLNDVRTDLRHPEPKQEQSPPQPPPPPPKRQSTVQDAVAKFERRSPEASSPPPVPPPVVTYVEPPPPPPATTTATTTAPTETTSVSRPHSPKILPPPSSPIITPDTTHPHVLPLLRQQHYAHMMQETRDVARRLSRHYHDGANEEWERAMLEAALMASMQEHEASTARGRQQQRQSPDE
jgi:hypothetical protein